MAEGIVKYEDLAELTGYSEPHQVRQWLTDNGIAEFRVPGKRGRPCTTVKALNVALGLEMPASGAASITRDIEV